MFRFREKKFLALVLAQDLDLFKTESNYRMIKYKMVASMEAASKEMMSPVVVRPTAYYYHLVIINPCVSRNAE